MRHTARLTAQSDQCIGVYPPLNFTGMAHVVARAAFTHSSPRVNLTLWHNTATEWTGSEAADKYVPCHDWQRCPARF
jgi:hypothetical protein